MRGTPSGVPGAFFPVDQPVHSPPPIVWSRLGRSFIKKDLMMNTPETAAHYVPLKSNISRPGVFFINANASPEALHEAAEQRMRTAANLLETLCCLNFSHGDVKDIPHIIDVLYVLTQDGCDLLEAAKWRAAAEA
ncbi:conserved hypothetical protein [Pseudomonas protegens Pf-5]|uniref:Uncharacterized protein n=3 Tax=Pseudomonas TaxID=286 RepID=Q4K5P8_PSEF5|nr:conserved hypothetical protein [Pseudomonas protegens Pf-5]